MTNENSGELNDENEPDPTLPSGLDWHMRTFAAEDGARELADRMAPALHYISRYIDLEMLDRISVMTTTMTLNHDQPAATMMM